MGAIFGGGGGGAPVIMPAAPVTPVAPSGPQLAPGQQRPGGPIVPIAAAGPSYETYDDRLRRLSNLSILGGGDAGNTTASGPSASTGAEGSSADGTI